jgi:hypothetical protein
MPLDGGEGASQLMKEKWVSTLGSWHCLSEGTFSLAGPGGGLGGGATLDFQKRFYTGS